MFDYSELNSMLRRQSAFISLGIKGRYSAFTVTLNDVVQTPRSDYLP